MCFMFGKLHSIYIFLIYKVLFYFALLFKTTSTILYFETTLKIIYEYGKNSAKFKVDIETETDMCVFT